MGSSLASIFLIAAVPALVAVAGAAVAAFRPPSPRLRSVIQHFAAGVVAAAATVELLADAINLDVLRGFPHPAARRRPELKALFTGGFTPVRSEFRAR